MQKIFPVKKMPEFLGIDTSNYTTSIAVFDSLEKTVRQSKKLLPVKKGQAGLRQSDALFHHVNQLTEVSKDILESIADLKAIGVSAFPRNISGSYMPCFLAGKTAAELMAAISGVRIYYTSHQAGHIAAALYSCDRLDMLSEPFIAFHVSGGTTDCLYCSPDDTEIVNADLFSASLDLKAGQAVDRVGLMLGLDFPCGKELEKLAEKSSAEFKIKPSMKGNNCSLSGIENKCGKMLGENVPHEDIAKFCLAFIGETLKEMAAAAVNALGHIPMIFAGGVMSNKFIKSMILSEHEAYFAKPEFSCDNAAGVSLIAYEKYRKKL